MSSYDVPPAMRRFLKDLLLYEDIQRFEERRASARYYHILTTSALLGTAFGYALSATGLVWPYLIALIALGGLTIIAHVRFRRYASGSAAHRQWRENTNRFLAALVTVEAIEAHYSDDEKRRPEAED